MSKVVVIGGGGHAKVIISILNERADFDVAGYTDIVDKNDVLGARYLGDDSVLADLINEIVGCSAVLGFGILRASDIVRRLSLAKTLGDLGFNLPAIVSPTAIVDKDVSFGPGTVVFNGAVINAGVVVGQYAIINTRSSVDHDCILGDNVHIAPGVTVGGGVTIGNNTLVGAGATVINGITIGAECVIGAGAVVVKDCRDRGKYFGVPARLVE